MMACKTIGTSIKYYIPDEILDMMPNVQLDLMLQEVNVSSTNQGPVYVEIKAYIKDNSNNLSFEKAKETTT